MVLRFDDVKCWQVIFFDANELCNSDLNTVICSRDYVEDLIFFTLVLAKVIVGKLLEDLVVRLYLVLIDIACEENQ